VLACPASLKGVLSAKEAAAALAEGLRGAVELPVADGGEGTLEVLFAALGGEWREAAVHDAFGRPRVARWLLLPDGTAAVESAEAIPLDPARLDPEAASSRGLGELILAVGRPRALLVGLGGTATMDAGAGLGLRELSAPTRVACDTLARLSEAPRLFGPQKGVADVEELERRFAALDLPDVPGGGAAGGLGAALAALGAELVPGAALVLDAIGFEPRGFDLVVTGEGTVDRTTATGKAPGEVARRCREAGVRCVVFGGRVVEPVPDVETVALSGDPTRARDDLVELGGALLDLV
jgi:glycerate kinase